jgi:antibiotic biosynthesis monooxygenase (ABM) superfamily enzyme
MIAASHSPVNTMMTKQPGYVTTKKILERGSGVDQKFNFLNRCNDGRSKTANAKISSKHNRFDIHMLNSDVG